MSAQQGDTCLRTRKVRFVPQTAPSVVTAEPQPTAPPREQLELYAGDHHLLPCNVEVQVNHAEQTAVVRRQSEHGGKLVLAHVGGNVLRAFKAWRTHTEPSERKQIVKRITELL